MNIGEAFWVRKETTIGSEQGRQSAARSLSRGLSDGGSGLSERELGRLEEKVRQMESRLNRLEDEMYERKLRKQALALSWWQVLVAGVIVIAASLGSAWLVLAFGG